MLPQHICETFSLDVTQPAGGAVVLNGTAKALLYTPALNGIGQVAWVNLNAKLYPVSPSNGEKARVYLAFFIFVFPNTSNNLLLGSGRKQSLGIILAARAAERQTNS